MPKLTWLGSTKEQKTPIGSVKAPDYTLELFRRYQKAMHLTNAQLAPLVGCKNEQAIKDKKAYGTDRWQKRTILQWAIALNVPIQELTHAMELDAQTHIPPS